ncbi:MAG: hypothetical protein NTY09_11190, partial [bacterium]|nr:hypothetical protein [bacterium]
EIPVGDTYEVEVEAYLYSEVNIYIPVSVSGMTCDERLDMGLEGYMDFVGGFFEDNVDPTAFLSEMGQDRVSQMYGDCRAAVNDALIDELPRSDREPVTNLRATLEQYEWMYYAITFFMGTGAAHNGSRTQAYREEFIDDVIFALENPDPVSDREVDDAIQVLDDLESVLDSVGEPYWDDDSEQIFYQTQDEYSDAVAGLKTAVMDLPDGIIVMVGDYLEQYLGEG